VRRRPTTVVLVHGTFARDAPWTRAESDFLIALAAQLNEEVRVVQHLWSGRNSFADRVSAAAELRQAILGESRTFPERDLFVIAHSHGGNVALSAAARIDCVRTIAGIVTLGTPFLRSQFRGQKMLVAWAISLGGWGLLAVHAAANLFGWDTDVFGVVSIALLALASLATYFMLKPVAARAPELPILNEIGYGAVHTPILCIRHSFDEASLWLGMLSLPRFIQYRLTNLAEAVIGRAAELAYLSVAISFFTFFFLTPNLFGYVGSALVLFLIFVPPLNVLSTLLSFHPFGFGARFSLATMFIDMSVHDRADRADVNVARFSGPLGLLRVIKSGRFSLKSPHSLGYSDPSAIARIAQWMTAIKH
jgi:hypothetical protein